MKGYVVHLDRIGEEDRPLVGAKAFALSQMRRAGLRVPGGFIVTTNAYRLFLQETELEPYLKTTFSSLGGGTPKREDLQSLQEKIKGCPLPKPILRALKDAYREMGEPHVAVRSSATCEDLPEASFAGQYNTYLNVKGLKNLAASMLACWASLWEERALIYHQRHGLSPLETAVAVIVQEQVPAEVSGVLFTLNPSTGREEEMLVEASWGLGEAVVSGRVTPDRFILDAWNETVRSQVVSDKRIMIIPKEPWGVDEVRVPQEKRNQPTLAEGQLLELLDMGHQVQEIYGYPQDIEWALHKGDFCILQARPLTSFTFAPEIGQWTSANFREVMPGFISPLSFSIIGRYEWGRALNEVFRRIKMLRGKREIEWGRMFFGRAYWNVGEVKRLTSLIPGFKERSFDEAAGLEPTYEGDGLVTPTTPATLLRALPILFALQNFYGSFWKEAKAYKEVFDQEEAALSRIHLADLNDDPLAGHVVRTIEFHHRTNRVALIISFLATQAQDDFSSSLEALNAGHRDLEPISRARLLTGLDGVSTGRLVVEMWKLGQEALKDEKVRRTILETESHDIPEALEGSPSGQAFAKKLEGFIHEFRYLSEKDEDMSLPRWDEDPTLALASLQSFVQAGEDEDPQKHVAEQKDVRLQEEARATKALSRGWLDRLIPIRRWLFFSQLATLKRYSWWREETRPMLGLAHYHCHKVFAEQGKRWAVKGYLEAPDDVFYLTREQILSALEGKLPSDEAPRQVNRHKRLKACYRNFEPPPTIGRGAILESMMPAATKGQVFKGVGCSAGRVTGRARVVHDLKEAHNLKRGEILVAPYTNPGWVPLFNLAAGIVSEEGGLISHGAIVAREYGIPIVLQIGGATRLFKDGELLLVDGDKGTVRIVDGA